MIYLHGSLLQMCEDDCQSSTANGQILIKNKNRLCIFCSKQNSNINHKL